MKSAKPLETFKANYEEASASMPQFPAKSDKFDRAEQQPQQSRCAKQNDQQQQPQPQTKRLHFLPHQRLSSPVFPVAMSPATKRRLSQQQQQQHQASSCGKATWDESMEKLSRELHMICSYGSRESLTNTSGTNSRPSSPLKSPRNSLGAQSKPRRCGRSPLVEFDKNLLQVTPTRRRVSLNIEPFDRESLKKIDSVRKNGNKSASIHRSYEDIGRKSRRPRSILKQSSDVSAKLKSLSPPATDTLSSNAQQNAEDMDDHVFESEAYNVKPVDFGFPELTLREVKVRHEETEVSLNRTLAKICRNKHTFLIQKNTPDSGSSSSTDETSSVGHPRSIEDQLQQLESPVIVVANYQQLFQQKTQSEASAELLDRTNVSPLEKIFENSKECEIQDPKLSCESAEDPFKMQTDKKYVTGEGSGGQKVIQITPPLGIRKVQPVSSPLQGSPIQANAQRRLFKLTQGARSLGRSFENIGIRFKLDLKDRNPYSIGVSVDEEAGFLTVFATSYTKFSSCDSGYSGDAAEASAVHSSPSDKSTETNVTHKSSFSSDAFEIEQLHLLRIGESTKAECLKCSIQDGMLRIREKECEAEFLNFESSTTKYLPILTDDLTNCQIVVTLFIPPEYRRDVAAKTIDNILVLSGMKGLPGSFDKNGSRTSQDVSDEEDDDGYEAASELSSYSSLSFTPPAGAGLAYRPTTSQPSTSIAQGSPSSVSSAQGIPIPTNSESNHPVGMPTFKVALNLPPETITRTIKSWMADCGQLIVAGHTTGVCRRMTCNF